MKAIFIPLNNFIYNHQKYGGHAPIDRWLNKFQAKSYYKTLSSVLVVILATPLIIIILFCWLFGKGSWMMHKIFAIGNKFHERFFDLKKKFKPMENEGYRIVVYYSPAQVPAFSWRRNLFYKQLAGIKARFNALEVACTASSDNILEIIHRNSIDASKAIFYTDLKVKIDLNNLSSLMQVSTI